MKGNKKDNVKSKDDYDASNMEIMVEADIDTTGRYRC